MMFSCKRNYVLQVNGPSRSQSVRVGPSLVEHVKDVEYVEMFV